MATQLLQVTYELIGEFNGDDFEQVFATKVAQFSVGDQYKIKNELIRICEPCEKVIDLRKAVSGKCRKFLHKGRVHYLDELAIETFNEGLTLYGQYTLGLYDEVHNTDNNFKVLQRQAELEQLNAQKCEQQRKDQKLQHILAAKLNYDDHNYPVHLIRFGDYFNRDEERMNYSVAATLRFADGRKVEAVTKDLSHNGLYLRIPLMETVAEGDVVEVVLSGQDSSYQSKIADGAEYEVKRIEYLDGVIWLGLILTSHGPDSDDWYACHISDLISCNKIVYKVNLDNAIDAALKQGHEQVFFSRSVTASLFVESLGSQHQLKYALTCGRSDDLLRFFSDVNQRQYLLGLFERNFLRQFISADEDEILLFCFNHKLANQLLYFAAFDFQLDENEGLKRLFCGYGAKKDSWRVYKVKRVKLTSNNIPMPFKVPERGEVQINELADDAVEAPKPIDLSKLSYALLITRVDDQASSEVYRSWTFDSALMTQITGFQLRSVDSSGFEWLNYGLEELRHEPRFAYKTKVLLNLPTGQVLPCTSIDFSIRGIQLVLPQPIEVKHKQTLLLSFPLLQKITRQLQLCELQYQLVGSDPDQTILYLQALEIEDVVHHGVKFFGDLIKRNKDKLTLVGESAERCRLTQTLKNLYQQHLQSFPFYLNRVGGRLRMTKLVADTEQHPLLPLLQAEPLSTQVNLAALFDNPAFSEFINYGAGLNTGIEARLDEETVRSIDLYLGLNIDEHKDGVIGAVKTNVDFANTNELLPFVQTWLSKGRFFAFRVYLGPVERVEVRKIAAELGYIHHYAQHKSKRIAQLLTKIYYVGEWVDIGRYILHYLDCDKVEVADEQDLIELDF
jgi:hypothetical protein